jgi:hypothetical protein
MLHVLTCKSGDKWAVSVREHISVTWSLAYSGIVLRTAIDASFAHGFGHLWTFSERQFDEVAADVAEEPEQLPGVDPAVSIEILAPEGRFADDDRWATLMRVQGRSDLFVHGTFKGFRLGAPFEAVIKDKVLTGFFGFDRQDQYWRTFMPPKLNETVDRPHFKRELYIRPTWVARQIANFPEFRDGPIVSPEQAARRLSKLPRNKSALKRAQRAANHERFRAEAAERARQREAAQ